ncbi:hypothetical protein C798_23530 [Herbaspirillum rubrisubalbicans Os34]|uniref:ATPase AAA-type core domain-containing protein n=1 Tax=Herbaspirillum rubrisubalbicans Os34 TaxID=1235827 RepID=A0A6M3ZXL5_9BURK|nr:AAA family ATPase [Herbaspirillum rubrisubalbicans]QJQ03091.1 hypothetical protein C798_23530 [Herbaspirillum rubrisubalbicans Os34]
MYFFIHQRKDRIPDSDSEFVALEVDKWNDYSFVTQFFAVYYSADGESFPLGRTKIGFKGQTTLVNTYQKLDAVVPALSKKYFSLGSDDDFYKNVATLPEAIRNKILKGLRDIVACPEIVPTIEDEEVFNKSLLRDISMSIVRGQYSRILDGLPALTDFHFRFVRDEDEDFGEVELSFRVEIDKRPSTNIHAIIGRNGAGKTSILNGMIEAITNPSEAKGRFEETDKWGRDVYVEPMSTDYFTGLVSVSFSSFDSFPPPSEQPDPAKGTQYFYIGLKDPANPEQQRSIKELRKEFALALGDNFCDENKTRRWRDAIKTLSSDDNFAAMNLVQLEDIFNKLMEREEKKGEDGLAVVKYLKRITPILNTMSSGHAIVLHTITRLVRTVNEKTLVLIDEPESHLHPPLLSAFVRALADLLHDRNGVAIIATHSPVLLQEIPKRCVWKITRAGSSVRATRPNIETFGENVGILTSDVFSLEVERSGFHAMLANSVEAGKTYEQILAEYQGQIGIEGRSILTHLVATRDAENEL